MTNNLKIVFAADDNYAQHMGASILSLFENNKSFVEIDVYILDNGIGKTNLEKLLELKNSFLNRKIIFIDVNLKLDYLKNKFNIPSTIAISSYSRLFITELLEIDSDRIIYADSDSLFLNSLDALWQSNLEDYFLAGVDDLVNISFKKSIGLSENSHYVNAGFLLINLKKWRENHVFKKFIDVIIEHNGTVPHHDQGVINTVFKNEILILPPKYNVVTTFFEFKEVQKLKEFFMLNKYYSQTQIDEAKNDPVFLHFTPSYSKRPWFKKSTHPLKKDYFYYLNKTNWKDYKLKRDNRKIKVLILENLFWSLGPNVVKHLLKLKKYIYV